MVFRERLETGVAVLLDLLQLLEKRLHTTEEESQTPFLTRNVRPKDPVVLE
jgi:hypothetical protein